MSSTAGSSAVAAKTLAETVVYVERVSPATVAATPARLGPPAPAPRRPIPTMSQHEESFDPPVVVVTAGDTVSFVNRDHVFHNAFSLSATRKFDVGKFGPGSSRRVAFPKPGIVPVFCELHPGAAGYVFVAPAATTCVRPNASGAWALAPLPPGDYVVHAWHPDFGERRWNVTLQHESRALSLEF